MTQKKKDIVREGLSDVQFALYMLRLLLGDTSERMKTMNNDYTFLLGWMLFKSEHQEWMSPRVPQPLLSASSCICGVRPDRDDWYAEEQGLSAFVLQHQCNAEGNFIFLNTAANATGMNERWLGGAYTPVGLALRPETAGRFNDMLLKNNTSGNLDAPLQLRPLTGRERLLGYEVLSYNYGWCSYLCSSLEDRLLDDFGGHLNEHGLITDGEVAERFAEACAANGWGEPGFRFACALFGI